MIADKMDSKLFPWDLPKLRKENEERKKKKEKNLSQSKMIK